MQLVLHLPVSQPKKGTCDTIGHFWVFFYGNQFKKDNEKQLYSLKDLMFFVMKGYLPMRIIESIWLQRFAYMLCPRVIFPTKKVLVNENLLGLVKKTMVTYVNQH